MRARRLTGRAVLPVLACLGLASCGGSSTSISDAGANGLPFASAGLNATASTFEALAGETFTAAGHAARHEISGTGGLDSTARAQTATLTLLSGNRLRLSANGETITLPEIPAGVYPITVAGSSANLVVNANTYGQIGSGKVNLVIPAFATGGSDAQSLMVFRVDRFDDTTDRYTESFYVSGFETRGSDMPRSGSATYTGSAGIRSFMVQKGNAAQRTVLNDAGRYVTTAAGTGTLTMDADFGTGTVTGLISGTADAQSSGVPIFNNAPVRLEMNGTISGTGVSGTLTDIAGSPDLVFDNGRFTGRFYDTGASEVGGTFSVDISGTALDEPTTGAGVFAGSR